MSGQRLSVLQRAILTIVHQAPSLTRKEQLEADFLRRNGAPRRGVPAAHVRLTVASARQRLTTGRSRWGWKHDIPDATFHADFSRSLRNLAAKGWLDLWPKHEWKGKQLKGGWVKWLTLTLAGREILKAKNKASFTLSSKQASGNGKPKS